MIINSFFKHENGGVLKTILFYSDSHKYVPIESFPVTIFFKPTDDLVWVGKLSEQIRAR
jgi:hypothetical protein